jgi:hypothetical protein
MNNFLGHKGVPLPQMKSALRPLEILPERWSCHLPHAVLDLRPTLAQQRHFLLPTDQWGQAGTPSRLQARGLYRIRVRTGHK